MDAARVLGERRSSGEECRHGCEHVDGEHLHLKMGGYWAYIYLLLGLYLQKAGIYSLVEI